MTPADRLVLLGIGALNLLFRVAIAAVETREAVERLMRWR